MIYTKKVIAKHDNDNKRYPGNYNKVNLKLVIKYLINLMIAIGISSRLI